MRMRCIGEAGRPYALHFREQFIDPSHNSICASMHRCIDASTDARTYCTGTGTNIYVVQVFIHFIVRMCTYAQVRECSVV